MPERTGLKAYKVNCHDDDHGCAVTFAKRINDVSKRENSEHCDCEFLSIAIRRAPQFDKYAPGPLKVEHYLAEGWFFPCANCEEHLYEDDKPLISDNESAFCNHECLEEHLARYRKYLPDAHDSIIKSVASMERLLATHQPSP